MERAARLINNDRYSQRMIDADNIVRAIWPAAVGKAIARHTCTLKVVRELLVVEVEDATWQKQLFPLSGQILARIQKLTGSTAVQDIEFRVGIPKRQPQKERQRVPGANADACSEDEADQIQDPVLKKVYRLSRSRATA